MSEQLAPALTQKQRISAAYEVLAERGWSTATPLQAAVLPLGDAHQRRTVRAALDRGGWDVWGSDLPEKMAHAPRHLGVLGVYAARAGTPVRQVAALIDHLGLDHDAWGVCVDVLARRSPEAESAFVASFWGEFMRSSTNSASHASSLILNRVQERGLPLPESADYSKDYWAHAAARLGATAELKVWEVTADPAPEETLRPRCAEHLALSAGLGAPVTGPLGPAVAAALAAGWVVREDVIGSAIVGLDAAQRPGDRKVWAQLLGQVAGLSGEEALAHIDAFVPLLSTGEGPLIEAVGVPLLGVVPDERLGELVLALSTATAAKSRSAVLRELRARPVPAEPGLAAEVLESLVPWDGQTGPVHKALAALRAAWAVEAQPEPEVELYPWPETPPLWEVPRVDFGEASEASLAAAAAPLIDRGGDLIDLNVERFVALAHALALSDPGAVKRVVKAASGSVDEYRPGLDDAARWALHGRQKHQRGNEHLAAARTTQVMGRLGTPGVLLSAPDWEDLRVDAASLVAGLEALAGAGGSALDSDLVLALTRLEPSSVSAGLRERLASLSVPVVAWNGPLHRGPNAAQLVLEYLEHPVSEPRLVPVPGTDRFEWSEAPSLAALGSVGTRPLLNQWNENGETLATFPAWGDAVGGALGHGWYEPAEDVEAHAWAQVARRSAPLTPGLAVNLLAALRRRDPAARAGTFDAARQAWERGLLLPGVADLAFIDWSGTPTQLGALSAAWLEAAHDGLLPVIWPLLDAICGWADRPGRPPSGLSDVTAAMATLAPSVAHAVGQGAASSAAADVPGLRALAARQGGGLAIANARAALELLPPPTQGPTTVAAPPAPRSRPSAAEFEASWPGGLPNPAVIDDGVTVTPRKLPRPASRAGLVFDLELPGDARVFRADKWTWVYDLYSSRTCHVSALLRDGTAEATERFWLAWDAQRAQLTAHSFPARGESEVLSRGLAIVAVGLIGQDGDGGFSGRDCVERLVRQGFLGVDGVRGAVKALLPCADAVSPARLAAMTLKVPGLLPALWPLLTEPVAFAAQLDAAPRWLGPVLDAALLQAPVLREAAVRGLMPSHWEGLEDLAARPGKAAAYAKARALREALFGEGDGA